MSILHTLYTFLYKGYNFNKEIVSMNDLLAQANEFIGRVEELEVENAAAERSKQTLENSINELIQNNMENKEALDIATHAIEILRQVSDAAVSKAYNFLTENLNITLERMFANTTRKIEIHEYTRNNQYPQLELILHVNNDKTRSLKSDSGHGIAQIISFLSVLCLIVITGSRRILVMDEILSGVSVRNRKIVEEILWSFTEIGFQFIVNEHGFVPKGSHVYHLEIHGDVSTVAEDYIAEQGVYLQSVEGNIDKAYTNKTTAESDDIAEDTSSYATVNNEDTVISI